MQLEGQSSNLIPHQLRDLKQHFLPTKLRWSSQRLNHELYNLDCKSWCEIVPTIVIILLFLLADNMVPHFIHTISCGVAYAESWWSAIMVDGWAADWIQRFFQMDFLFFPQTWIFSRHEFWQLSFRKYFLSGRPPDTAFVNNTCAHYSAISL